MEREQDTVLVSFYIFGAMDKGLKKCVHIFCVRFFYDSVSEWVKQCPNDNRFFWLIFCPLAV